jgi:drug/metabolite transporter (DMT)-like permease
MDLAATKTTQRSSQIGGILLVNVATITWAVNMTLGRWMRGDIGPITVAAIRFTIASLFFVVLLRRLAPEERRLGPDRRLLFTLGLLGVTIFAPLLYLGLRYTTTVNATIINGLGPLITGILASLLIQEPMSRRQVGGAAIALSGVLILISGGTLAFWQTIGRNGGDLIMVAAISLWGLYSVLARRAMRTRSALSMTALSTFLGLPLLCLAAVWELRFIPVNPSPQLLLALLYVGIFPTVIGLLAWNEGVRRLGASGAMVFYNTLPLYGALLGVLLLNEPIGLVHLVGGALIIGGGVWAARGHL